MKFSCGWAVLFLMGWAGALVAADYQVGDKLETRWGSQWYAGEVLEVGDGQYKVRYDGYGAAWDEWAKPEKLRRKPVAPPAGAVAPANPAGSWKNGDRVEALSYGMWYKGTIVEVGDGQWKVAYDGYSRSADEWRKADQLRALGAAAVAVPKPAVVATRPAGAKAGLEGAFLRVETFYFSGSLSLDNQGWFFTPDGRFSKSPEGGFRPADFKPAGAGDGTYWIADGKITFAWADGAEPTVYDFEAKADELKWGGLGVTRVEGFPKGWRFDGEYEGGASIGGGALMASNTLVFRRDGTFGQTAVASFRSESDRSVVSGGSTGEAAGTYEFDGFTLTLKSNGGEVQAFTVFAFGDKDAAGRPDYLYRDGTMMRRQDRQ